MLVITRKEGQEVVIGDPKAPLGIVRIASIKGDRVRIAFEFPREISVHRREVADQINLSEPGEDVDPKPGEDVDPKPGEDVDPKPGEDVDPIR